MNIRQQAWTVEEAQATSVVFQNITEWEKDTGFDFHLNTGDISQNANRSFEWRYHYKYADDLIRTIPHQITCGNNDLIDKKYSTAFTWYMTPEDHFLPDGTEGISRYNSCHSYDLGFVHFVCINSNQDYAMFDELGGEKVDDWIQRECAWLDADLTLDEANPTTRWTICYMHYAPFTCVRPAWVQRFIPVTNTAYAK